MSTVQELENRIIDLETRIAFQEKVIDELSSVMASQGISISVLVEQITSLKEQIGNGVSEMADATKPPHY